jgi:saccharopine dehydrogenase (NAD+, L-lysine-forming)
MFEGKIKTPGVLRPVTPEIYNLILDEMESLGVVFKEETLAQTIWIRAEVKGGERRVPITPHDAKTLVDYGYNVVVEKSVMRAFEDSDFKEAGATLVEAGSWVNAPNSAIILGLKELPEDYPAKLHHRHIFFAHCYKNQDGWKELLTRFARGGGMIWDLEFLVDDSGRRIAAFGRAAGIVGAALGILNWAVKVLGQPLPELTFWASSEALVRDVRAHLEKAIEKAGRTPSVLVLGALGRCGGGASWFSEMVGLNPIKWDLAETRAGGPFEQLLEVDILVNSIYLSNKIPPFLTKDMLEKPDVRLSVFVDVSCDYNNPANPFPIYNTSTDLKHPVLEIQYGKNSLSIISIDHLPTLIPSESSSEFSSALIKYMNDLQSPVWARAESLYQEMVSRIS